MSDVRKLEMLLGRESRNALDLAAMAARTAARAAERIGHVVDITDPAVATALRSAAIRLRMTASECLETGLVIAAEAARLELIATFQVGIGE